MRAPIRLLVAATVCLACLAAGCSKDPYADYVGYWEAREGPHAGLIVQISQDGEAMVLDDRVLERTPEEAASRKGVVLRKSDGQLAIDGMFGGMQIALSADRNRLRGDSDELHRVSPERVAERRAEIEKARNEEIARQARCKALRDDFNTRMKTVNAEPDIKKRSQLRNELLAEFRGKRDADPGCFISLLS